MSPFSAVDDGGGRGTAMSERRAEIDRRWGQRLLAEGPHAGGDPAGGLSRAAHLDPEMPRAVVRWTGEAWVLVKVVPNSVAAKKLMHPKSSGPDPW
ncbi:DUF6087 family protein [Streptomyces violascens]|uniref:DUF6087 family protein n=1 Tax=Streptomyces violascens TaxID=67381 RepID=UPI00365107FB